MTLPRVGSIYRFASVIRARVEPQPPNAAACKGSRAGKRSACSTTTSAGTDAQKRRHAVSGAARSARPTLLLR